MKLSQLTSVRQFLMLATVFFILASNVAYSQDSDSKSVDIPKLQEEVAKGSSSAMNRLGIAYSRGQGGLSVDHTAAFELFLKAAKLGNPVAMLNVGIGYESGKGVTKDTNEAIAWYKKAEQAGNAKAKEKLEKLSANNAVATQSSAPVSTPGDSSNPCLEDYKAKRIIIEVAKVNSGFREFYVSNYQRLNSISSIELEFEKIADIYIEKGLITKEQRISTKKLTSVRDANNAAVKGDQAFTDFMERIMSQGLKNTKLCKVQINKVMQGTNK